MGIEKIGAVRRILATVTPLAYTGNGAFPSALHIGAIAALHTGHIENETERARACEDVVSALVFATKEARELAFEEREYKREPWIEGGIQKGFHATTAAWITAADVCAWFALKQSPPGPLLAFWLAQVPCSGFDELARQNQQKEPAAPAPYVAATSASATAYKRMTEAELLERMPLPKFINIPCAAQILGSGTNQVMERIELGHLRCWSHSTQWGLCSFDDRDGVSIEKPYLTPETNPSDVEVASKDILKSWCMAMEAFPEDSVEDVSARALKRYSALIEKARQGPGAASAAVIRLEDVDSFERMCQYRQQFAHLESQKRPHWTPKERCFLLQRHEDGMSIAGMARACGHASEGSIKNQLARAKKEREKAQDAAAPANQNPPQNAFQMVAKTLART